MWTMPLAFLAFSILLSATVLQEDYMQEGYGSSSALIYGGLMLYMLVFGNTMNVEKYEDKHHAYRILARLPVSRSDIVAGKFILVLAGTVLGVFTLEAIFRAFSILSLWPNVRFRYLLLSGSISLILNGIAYAGVFRYGYHKIRAWIMVLYILSLLGPQLLIFLQSTRGAGTTFVDGIGAMSGAVFAVLCCVSFLVFVLCIVVSVKTREIREL